MVVVYISLSRKRNCVGQFWFSLQFIEVSGAAHFIRHETAFKLGYPLGVRKGYCNQTKIKGGKA